MTNPVSPEHVTPRGKVPLPHGGKPLTLLVLRRNHPMIGLLNWTCHTCQRRRSPGCGDISRLTRMDPGRAHSSREIRDEFGVHDRFSASDDQRTGNHVVQRLFAFGEAGHDVANAQDHSRNVLREVPAGSTGE
jgi:hypothetical protein